MGFHTAADHPSKRTAMPALMPILILAGSDRRPGPRPTGLATEEMLTGFKGALPYRNDRCLAAELVERFRQSQRFADPLLVGPRSVYTGLVDCELVHAEGTLTATFSRVIRLLEERYDPDLPVAVSTCDILPTAEEIGTLLARGYDRHADCHFWWQVVAASQDAMGAGAWKPHYGLRATPADPPRSFYPGHLVILRPAAVRLELLNRLLVSAYRHRNRPLRQRFLPMLLEGMGMLARQDLLNLGRLQLPMLMWSVPWHILRAYRGVRKGTLTLAEFETHLARTVLHRRFRRGPRPFVIDVTDQLSFAKDIDTKTELEEVRARHMADDDGEAETPRLE